MTVSHKLSMRPLYLQVRDLLLERISSAHWKPGASLPSELDLAKELGVSSGTVRKALDTLEAERVVARRQGRGTFVSDSASQGLAWRYNNIRDKDNQAVEGVVGATVLSSGPANDEERQHLALAEGAQVVRVARVLSNGNRPYIYEEISLPERLFPDLVARGEFPLRVADLAQQFRLILGRGTESISVTTAGEPAASKLSVVVGTPLLRLERTVSSIDGMPVHWRVALCHFKSERYVTEFN